ncbi:hypothetical protein ACFE04_002916 [Oxalis oulophora]
MEEVEEEVEYYTREWSYRKPDAASILKGELISLVNEISNDNDYSTELFDQVKDVLTGLRELDLKRKSSLIAKAKQQQGNDKHLIFDEGSDNITVYVRFNYNFLDPEVTSRFDCYAIGDGKIEPLENYDEIAKAKLSDDPIFVSPPNAVWDGTAIAAFGKHVYIVGGGRKVKTDQERNYYYDDLYEYYSDVYRIDTTSPGNGWEKLNPLTTPRAETQLVSVYGKLYAFGKCEHHTPLDEQWAEVFDNNEWTSLNITPIGNCKALPWHIYWIVPIPHSNKIVFCGQNEKLIVMLYCCDLQSNTCYIYDEYFSAKVHPWAPAQDGFYLYFFFDQDSKSNIHCTSLHCYNLQTKSWFPKPIGGFNRGNIIPPNVYDMFERRRIRGLEIINLGIQRFCIIWHDDSTLYWTKFIISIDNDTDTPRASHFSTTKKFNISLVDRLLSFVVFHFHGTQRFALCITKDSPVLHDPYLVTHYECETTDFLMVYGHRFLMVTLQFAMIGRPKHDVAKRWIHGVVTTMYSTKFMVFICGKTPAACNSVLPTKFFVKQRFRKDGVLCFNHSIAGQLSSSSSVRRITQFTGRFLSLYVDVFIDTDQYYVLDFISVCVIVTVQEQFRRAFISIGGTRVTNLVNRWLTVLASMFGMTSGNSYWGKIPPTVPVIIFSLVYHDLVPVLCAYLDGDITRLRASVILESIIPLGALLVWNSNALSLSAQTDQSVDHVELLMRVPWSMVSFMVEAFSLIAVGTSIIETLLGFSEFFKEQLNNISSTQISLVHQPPKTKIMATAETLLYTLADVTFVVDPAAPQKNAGWFILKDGLSAVHVPYSYGFAIILLTVIVKVATLPLTKQHVTYALLMLVTAIFRWCSGS